MDVFCDNFAAAKDEEPKLYLLSLTPLVPVDECRAAASVVCFDRLFAANVAASCAILGQSVSELDSLCNESTLNTIS